MPAVLLDRDGVINESPERYVLRWEQFRFLPSALEALAALTLLGLRLAVVTNQSAVGRGLMAAHTLDQIHERMLRACAHAGADIDGVFACPHAPQDGCCCRKPAPGLLHDALAELAERPERCVFVGDSEADLLAARAAGVPFGLVLTGHGRETQASPTCKAHPPLFVARDIMDAVSALRRHFARAA